MPHGYERSDQVGVSLVMKLEISLDRLRQSPKNWFGTMDQCLGNIKFCPLKSGPCVYNEDGILLLGANELLLSKLKKQLMGRFEMTNIGDVSRVVVGMNVARDHGNGTITINHRDYTEDVTELFGMKDCNPAYMPMWDPSYP